MDLLVGFIVVVYILASVISAINKKGQAPIPAEPRSSWDEGLPPIQTRSVQVEEPQYTEVIFRDEEKPQEVPTYEQIQVDPELLNRLGDEGDQFEDDLPDEAQEEQVPQQEAVTEAHVVLALNREGLASGFWYKEILGPCRARRQWPARWPR